MKLDTRHFRVLDYYLAIVIGIFIQLVVFLLILIQADSRYQEIIRARKSAPCQSFRDDAASRVPARCIKYFQEGQ